MPTDNTRFFADDDNGNLSQYSNAGSPDCLLDVSDTTTLYRDDPLAVITA